MIIFVDPAAGTSAEPEVHCLIVFKFPAYGEHYQRLHYPFSRDGERALRYPWMLWTHPSCTVRLEPRSFGNPTQFLVPMGARP